MTKAQALALLGLDEDASPDRIRAAYEAKRAEAAERLEAAPTDALGAKYREMLTDLEAARALLLVDEDDPAAGPSASPLSGTKIADLPGAAPSFTEGPGGPEAAGAGVGIAAGDVLLNRYEVKEQIGAGGMGAVFRAHDRSMGEDIALKVMLPGLLASDRARERFFAEAKISTRLSHPNIVNVFDVQTDGRHTFLTMELLEGQTLRQVMEARKAARQTISVERCRELLAPLCDALAYAHQQTVHRDLKPENVFLTEAGEVKLMDFGIARVMSGSQMTETVTVMGTAYYMAPEQLEGSSDVDARADQYALGVMAYEMVAGRVPVGMVEPLHQLRDDVPKGFSQAVRKALSPRPEGRFEHVAELAEQLTATGSVSLPARIAGWTTGTRGRKVAGLAALVIGALTLASLLGPGMFGPGEDELAGLREARTEARSLAAAFENRLAAGNLDGEVAELVANSELVGERPADLRSVLRMADLQERRGSVRGATFTYRAIAAGYDSLLADLEAAPGAWEARERVREDVQALNESSSLVTSEETRASLQDRIEGGERQISEGQFVEAGKTFARVERALERALAAEDSARAARSNRAAGAAKQPGDRRQSSSGNKTASTSGPYTSLPSSQNSQEIQQTLAREYPPALRDNGIGGVVQLKLLLDREGDVAASEIAESSGYPALDEAALAVAAVMQFSPAMKEDGPVPVWISVPITFEAR